MGEIFSYQPEPVTRELRAYIEDQGGGLIKKNDQRSCTWFLGEYVGLYLYDIDI